MPSFRSCALEPSATIFIFVAMVAVFSGDGIDRHGRPTRFQYDDVSIFERIGHFRFSFVSG